MAVGITVQEIRDGSLFYKLPSGRQMDRPIDQIRYLQITGWDVFNQAEKHRLSGNWRGAAFGYEQAIAANASAEGDGTLDRVLLARCRLIGALDEEGRFDKAVAAYLEVLDRMPAVVDSLRPKKTPPAGSTFLPAAAEAVDAFLATRRGTPVAVPLARWRSTWSKDPGSGPATAPAPIKAAMKEAGAGLGDIEAMIAASRFEDALKVLDSLDTESVGVRRAEVFYWRGRSWLGKSEQPGSPDADRDARRAGLAFMRVAVHFPGHKLAPESLYRAGQICQRAGHPELAANLWAELVGKYPADKAWGEQARRALASVSTRPAADMAAQRR